MMLVQLIARRRNESELAFSRMTKVGVVLVIQFSMFEASLWAPTMPFADPKTAVSHQRLLTGSRAHHIP